MMGRIIAIASACVLAIALSGCGIGSWITKKNEPVRPPTSQAVILNPWDHPGNPTFRDVLGVNITWNDDKLINESHTRLQVFAKHVRHFDKTHSHYQPTEGELRTPREVELKVCSDLSNPWSCDRLSARSDLAREVVLLDMFEGDLVNCPEIFTNKHYPAPQYGWPGKFWSTSDLGSKPFQVGYNEADTRLKAYEQLPEIQQARIHMSLTNEEWRRYDLDGSNRKEAYDQYRLGKITAHKEHVTRGGKVQIGTGARSYSNRVWKKQVLAESVLDIPKEIWVYLNEVGGFTSFHLHPRNVKGDILKHPDVDDAANMVGWVVTNYPNIRPYITELSYTSSEDDKLPSSAEIEADWINYEKLIRWAVAAGFERVYLYQADDHKQPEGAFTGTSTLREPQYSLLKALAAQPLN